MPEKTPVVYSKKNLKTPKTGNEEKNLFLGSIMNLSAQEFTKACLISTSKPCLRFISMLGSGKPNGIVAKF